MAKEDKTIPAVEEPKAEAKPVYPDGAVEIGTAPGEWDISHQKKDGSSVVITVITN